MFNLLAQYIGYSSDNQVETEVKNDALEYNFGEKEDGDWTLVDLNDTHTRDEEEEDYHRVPSPAPVISLHSSIIEDENLNLSISAVSNASARRVKCFKNPKRQRSTNAVSAQQRPNQMKRSNQVACNRANKCHQKMRQIVHQPRKY